MNCPKCFRPTPQHRRQCLYCGARLAVDESGTADSGESIEADRKAQQAVLEALPRELRREVEVALQEARQEMIDAKQVDTDISPAVEQKDGRPAPAAGIDKTLKACEIARRQFDKDVFDYDEYRRMVMDALKGYIDQMDNQTKLNYVLHDIKDAAEGEYLDDDMLKALQHHAVAAAAGPGLLKESKARRRFALGRLWRKK